MAAETTAPPRCFLVTVGASLIEKYRENQIRPEIAGTKDLEELQSSDIQRAKTEWEKKSWRNKNNWGKAKTALTEALKDMPNLQRFRKASAELNSLYHIKPCPGTEEKVILFATRTPVGDLCSEVLKDALTEVEILPQKVKLPCENVEIRTPEGLGKANDPAFVEKGLPQFISELSRRIQKHEKDNYEVILIPTGGYKSLIPYATLAGILHMKEIKYIYEDSDELLPLPPLPVGLALEQWQPAYMKLEHLISLPAKDTEAHWKSLDSSFKNLMDAPQSEHEPYRFRPLGEFLMERYRSLRRYTPLQLQTRGAGLLTYLKRDSSKPDLREFFKQLLEIGPYLWLGDKIPETADHALHHHTNLFEIAEVLLLPMLDSNPDFLKPEELFILLCTIYFHDWGHIFSELDGKPLLPTQVREFHHILGYERLKSIYWRKRLIRLGLHWTGYGDSDDNAKKLWECYLKIIATIGLFHRKKMPLQNADPCYYCPVNKKQYVPLIKEANSQREQNEGSGWSLRFEGKKFSPGRAILVAALFRLIDCLDTQMSRVGSAEEVLMKAGVVQSDSKDEEKRSQRVEEMLKHYLVIRAAPGVKQKVDCLADRLIGSYSSREGATAADRPKSDELDVEKEIDCIIAEGFSPNEPNEQDFTHSLLHLYVETRCRAFFKKEQPKHYYKHLIVRRVLIAHERDNTGHVLTINFEPEESAKLAHVPEFLGEHASDLPTLKDIIKDAEEEYAKIKEILKQNGLGIIFREFRGG